MWFGLQMFVYFCFGWLIIENVGKGFGNQYSTSMFFFDFAEILCMFGIFVALGFIETGNRERNMQVFYALTMILMLIQQFWLYQAGIHEWYYWCAVGAIWAASNIRSGAT